MLLASGGQESQIAFYVADSGLECVLYYDVKLNDSRAIATSSIAHTIDCNGMTSTVFDGDNNSTSPYVSDEFTLYFGEYGVGEPSDPDTYNEPCAKIILTKEIIIGSKKLHTKIQSRGYNTCNPTDKRRVERGIKAEYDYRYPNS
ncbi:hypothetical protein ACFLY7_01405 [Patescibacteria group bacterium]